MLSSTSLGLAVVAGLTLAVLPAHAEHDSALINALVRKGVLTDKEATEIRSDMEKHEKESSAHKIKLSNSITELKLYGDIRLRYQYDNKDPQIYFQPQPDDVTPVGNQRSRWRFRLRLNADFRLTENFSGGVELQTSQASDSANQTYQDGFADYQIFISKAYLQWDPNKWLSITAGKFSNPFYTTDLVWDTDINPTGIAESIALHKLLAFGGTETEGNYAKDGKAVAPTVKPSPWELTLVAGQFIFDDNLEGGGTDPATPDNDQTTDAYLFQTQLITSYAFDGGPKLTVAPGWFIYVNGSATNLQNENPFQDTDFVSGATRNLNLLLLPGDLTFKLGSLKTKFYWDFTYNIEGRKRAENIYQLVNGPLAGSVPDNDDPSFRPYQHKPEDDYAYLVGMQFGENKKKGDLSFVANWRQVGIGSIDPNLNDSDWGQSELNQRGFKFGLAYNFTNFAIGTVTYYYAWNLRDNLVGGEATNDNSIADSNNAQVLQVDLSVKF